jgi:hypothetical protein
MAQEMRRGVVPQPWPEVYQPSEREPGSSQAAVSPRHAALQMSWPEQVLYQPSEREPANWHVGGHNAVGMQQDEPTPPPQDQAAV